MIKIMDGCWSNDCLRNYIKILSSENRQSQKRTNCFTFTIPYTISKYRLQQTVIDKYHYCQSRKVTGIEPITS